MCLLVLRQVDAFLTLSLSYISLTVSHWTKITKNIDFMLNFCWRFVWLVLSPSTSGTTFPTIFCESLIKMIIRWIHNGDNILVFFTNKECGRWVRSVSEDFGTGSGKWDNEIYLTPQKHKPLNIGSLNQIKENWKSETKKIVTTRKYSRVYDKNC